MTSLHDPSVDELRRESERSRATLTSTVAQLREKVSDTADDLKTRLSPAHIKEEVKDYVREESEQFLHSLERKARENPLRAVALGAALAYPLRGILKSIAVPMALVGAGLWLSRPKTGGDHYARGVARRASEPGSASAKWIPESVRDAGAALAASAEAVTDKVRVTAHDVRDSVADMGQTIAGVVKDKAADATNSVAATASALRDKGIEFGNKSRNAFEDLVDRNPLLVGAMALAIGGFIAASLPASDVENRVFGERSDELKDKALEAASEGVERVKDVAAGMVGDVAAAAAHEGLNAEGLTRVVEGVTDGVKSVVDKGLKTALGEENLTTAPGEEGLPSRSSQSF